nr:hypothetical protein [Tanacetum cinerariifolium]
SNNRKGIEIDGDFDESKPLAKYVASLLSFGREKKDALVDEKKAMVRGDSQKTRSEEKKLRNESWRERERTNLEGEVPLFGITLIVHSDWRPLASYITKFLGIFYSIGLHQVPWNELDLPDFTTMNEYTCSYASLECMDDEESRVAKEMKLFDALEHKSVVIEVGNQKFAIFTKAPLRAFSGPFMRYSLPCKVSISDYGRKMVNDVNMEIHGVKFKKSRKDALLNPLITEYEKRNKKNTITYSLQPVLNGDGDVFVDYSWERALSINNEVYPEWVLEFFSTVYFDKDVDKSNLMTETYDEIKKCPELIYCEYWTTKMLAEELDEKNKCLLKETGIPTQAGIGSSNFAYPTYEPPNVPPYLYPYIPYPHPYTYYPNWGNQRNQRGSYGLGGDDYFTNAMPDFGGNSSRYAVRGSSRGAGFDDEDMDE